VKVRVEVTEREEILGRHKQKCACVIRFKMSVELEFQFFGGGYLGMAGLLPILVPVIIHFNGSLATTSRTAGRYRKFEPLFGVTKASAKGSCHA
jgi:hypothetical protein